MKTIKDFYDNNSTRYETFEGEALHNKERFPLLYEIRNAEYALLKNATGKNTLYFATGSGRDAAQLTRLGAHLVTLDFSLPMLQKTCERFEREHLQYKLVKNYQGNLSKEYLDQHFLQAPNTTLILQAEIDNVQFPNSYFEWSSCYCTLPHMLEKAPHVLEKLVATSKNGAVSVYDKEKLPYLQQYYESYGFKARVNDRTINIEGGFSYLCVPQEIMVSTIEKFRTLKIMQFGLGKIYVWSEKV